MSKLSKFFANSHKKFKTQIRNRCRVCGRSRGFLRSFLLCFVGYVLGRRVALEVLLASLRRVGSYYVF